jgi:two-component system sensor histidine kinase KdpD
MRMNALWRRGGSALSSKWVLSGLAVALVGLAAAQLQSHGVPPRHLAVTISLLLVVALTALLGGRLPAIVAALASLIAFNYFFIPPVNAFSIPTSEEGLLLLGLLAVALVVGSLAERILAAKRQLSELAASERLQRTLLSAVSHDLKTPLTAILGGLNSLLVEDGLLSEGSRRELVAIAYDQAKRLERLVDGVLDMTRLEAGAVRLRREPAAVADVIRNALMRLHEAPSEGRYHIVVPSGLPSVAVDAVLLSTALANLLDNAAKFSTPETLIEVDARADDGQMLISVSDRGMGIPAVERERIFEKFYRVSDSHAISGSGLGLAIAKAIVDAHGGHIWAEARGGGGSILRVGLPLLSSHE